MHKEDIYNQPNEKIPAIKIRELVSVFIGILLLIFITNLIVFVYLENDTTSVGYSMVKRKWNLLKSTNRSMDWLILGDSSGNHGIDTEIISRRLKGTALNLCTIGDLTLINDVWMLDEFIKKNGPPKNVIIVHVADIWQRNINMKALAEIPLEWGFWNKMEPEIQLSPPDILIYIIARYVPLLSKSTTLSNLLILKKPGKNDGLKCLSNGFTPLLSPEPENVLIDVNLISNKVKNKRFYFSEHNVNAINRLIELSQKYAFKTFLVNSPVVKRLYENREFKNYFAQIQQSLSELASQNDRFFQILKEPAQFPEFVMQNADHLATTVAVQEYTNLICDEIKKIIEL